MNKKLKLLFIIFICQYLNLHAQSPNSDSDPQITDPMKWESSEMPVPFGLIVSASNPFFNAIEEVKGFNSMTYDVIAYYDTWQVGWGHKEYGDALMIMARTFGRDDYGSLYFEYGNSKKFQTKSIMDSGVVKDEFENYPFYGFGIRGEGGFDKSMRFSMFWDVSFGVLDMNESPKYFNMEFGAGFRLPISISATYLHLSGFFNRIPLDRFPLMQGYYEEEQNERYTYYVGFKARLSFALNFQY